MIHNTALIASGHITEDLRYGAGTLGCAMSHSRLWEMAAREERSITICEDAIVVSHDFVKQAKQVLSSLPADWDIVQWGYNFAPAYVWVDLGVSHARLGGYGARRFTSPDSFREFQEAARVPAAVRLLHSFGTQGYSISPTGARTALQLCLPLCERMVDFPDAGVRTADVGIDIALSGVYPAMQAYICLPQLMLRDGSGSVRRGLDAVPPMTS